jgi:hypothetical protein
MDAPFVHCQSLMPTDATNCKSDAKEAASKQQFTPLKT